MKLVLRRLFRGVCWAALFLLAIAVIDGPIRRGVTTMRVLTPWGAFSLQNEPHVLALGHLEPKRVAALQLREHFVVTHQIVAYDAPSLRGPFDVMFRANATSSLALPHWFLGSALAGALILPGLTARYRQRRGLCSSCGYDLRGARGRCPECGTTRTVRA